MRPKLPTAASLAAATAAAEEEVRQKALERAVPKHASTASLATIAKPQTPQDTGSPGEVAGTELSSGAVPAPGAVAAALEGSSAGDVPDPMDTDSAHVIQALDSKIEPEHADSDKAEEAAQSVESDKQPIAQPPLSDLEQ